MDRALAGKVVLITGGTGFLGSHLARTLGALGATVCIGYHKGAERAAALSAELIAAGVACTTHAFDATDQVAVGAEVAALVERHGRLDVLVHAVGIAPSTRQGATGCRLQPVGSVKRGDLEEAFAVNVLSAFYCLGAAIGPMVRGRWGRVVLIGSPAATGRAGWSVYSSTKSALVGLVGAAAREYARHGVCVNIVSPGNLEGTGGAVGPQREKLLASYPMGRFIDVAELGALVAFLTGEGGRSVTGQELVVDGAAAYVATR